MLCFSTFKDKVERSMPTGSSAKVAAFDAADPIWTTGNTQALNAHTRPQDGAYVIYTCVSPSVLLNSRIKTKLVSRSGTTGKPKGVDCSHMNLCNTLLNEPGKLGITVGTEVACVLMLSFDLCAWEILATLMNGGTLNLRGPSRRGGDREIWNACLSRVDVVISTPTGAQKYFPKRSEFPNIKTIVVGGEPCPVSLAEEWYVRFFLLLFSVLLVSASCLETEVLALRLGSKHSNVCCNSSTRSCAMKGCVSSQCAKRKSPLNLRNQFFQLVDQGQFRSRMRIGHPMSNFTTSVVLLRSQF